MTLEKLTAIIASKVPRLRPWEMEGLAKSILTQVGIQPDAAQFSTQQFHWSLEVALEFATRRPTASKEAKEAFMTDVFVNRMVMAMNDIGIQVVSEVVRAVETMAISAKNADWRKFDECTEFVLTKLQVAKE